MNSDLYKERVAKWTAVMAKATGINHRTVGANYGTRMPWLEFFRDHFPHIFEEEALSLECLMKLIEERWAPRLQELHTDDGQQTTKLNKLLQHLAVVLLGWPMHSRMQVGLIVKSKKIAEIAVTQCLALNFQDGTPRCVTFDISF